MRETKGEDEYKKPRQPALALPDLLRGEAIAAGYRQIGDGPAAWVMAHRDRTVVVIPRDESFALVRLERILERLDISITEWEERHAR